MPPTRSSITNDFTSKTKRNKLPANVCKDIVHEIRRGSLRALSDYESDDCSDNDMVQSLDTANCLKTTNTSYCSSNTSTVIDPKRKLNNTYVVTSNSSDSDENLSGNLSSQKCALSDYETGESNGRSTSSSFNNQKLEMYKSKLSSAKEHIESDLDSEDKIVPFKRRCKRKKSLAFETDTSDSDSQNQIAHLLKRQKTEDNDSNEIGLNELQFFNENVPTTSHSTSPSHQQFTLNSTKYNVFKENKVAKRTYSSSDDSDCSYFSSKSVSLSYSKKKQTNDLSGSNAHFDKPPRPGTSKPVKQLKKRRIIQNSESDDSEVLENGAVTSFKTLNVSNLNFDGQTIANSNSTSIDKPLSSEDSYDDSSDEEFPSQRITRSFSSKGRNQRITFSSSSEDSFEDSPHELPSSAENSPSSRNSLINISITSSGGFRENSPDAPPRRTTRSLSSTNSQQLNLNINNNLREDISEDSLDESNIQNSISVNRRPPNYRNNPSMVTANYRFSSLSLVSDNFGQHSTRQLRPRNLQRNTSHRVLVERDDFSSDSDIQPRTLRHSQRRVLSSNQTANSDSETSSGAIGRSDLNVTNEGVLVEESDDFSSGSSIQQRTLRHYRRRVVNSGQTPSSDSEDSSDNINITPSRHFLNHTNEGVLVEESDGVSSDSDIRPKTLRHCQRRVLASDHSSNSDSEDVIATSSRRRGRMLKIEESDDDIREQNHDSKNNSSSDSDNESEKCSICFEKFRLQEVGSPESCDHSFCAVCIQEWAKNNNTCPVDRKLFNSVTIRTHFQGRIDRQVPIETPISNPFEGFFDVITLVAGVDFASLEYVFDSESEGPDEICCLCASRNDSSDIIACDICNNVFHLRCLTPPLHHIPAGDWLCAECQLFRTSYPSSSSETDELDILAI